MNKYYEELMRSGVHIHVYREHLLHAKHLTFDDQIAVIGSSNLDMRSFLLNEEISLIVHDPEVAAAPGRVQERYFAESDELTLDIWRQRPRWLRPVPRVPSRGALMHSSPARAQAPLVCHAPECGVRTCSIRTKTQTRRVRRACSVRCRAARVS